jgi:hypothetical protein
MAARRIPSFVIESFQNVTIGIPGVKNRLNTMVITSRKKIVFMPLKMNLGGTLESLMLSKRNNPAITYPMKFLAKNRDIIKEKVATILTLGSSLWITDSVL